MTVLNDRASRVQEILDEKFTGLIMMQGDASYLVFHFSTVPKGSYMPNGLDDYQIDISEGVVLIKNQNTTIGYCRFNELGEIEYIYVNPLYRRKGFGTILINEIKKLKGTIARVHEPISPLGARFFKGIGLEQALSDGKGE
jgi:GNAT superfamily N-acetyltransferase